jgi:hypothetical protein
MDEAVTVKTEDLVKLVAIDEQIRTHELDIETLENQRAALMLGIKNSLTSLKVTSLEAEITELKKNGKKAKEKETA